jgi:hypothetical protein
MPRQSNLAVAAWEAPPWASSRVIDEETVEHCRRIGEVDPAGEKESLFVDVVQRDELDLSAEPVFVSRTSPQIRIAGIRLSPDQAHDLAGLLNSAVALIGCQHSGTSNRGEGIAPLT